MQIMSIKVYEGSILGVAAGTEPETNLGDGNGAGMMMAFFFSVNDADTHTHC